MSVAAGGGGTRTSEDDDDEFSIRLSDSEPLPLRRSQLPEVTESDWIHVLYGDDSGGGHLWGTGALDKKEFPERWDDEFVKRVVRSTLRHPGHARYDRMSESLYLYRIDDEVLTIATLRRRSADDPWRFITAFPVNGRGVTRNRRGGKRESVDFDPQEWLRYPEQ